MSEGVRPTGVARWLAWSRGSANRRIFAAALTVGGISLGVSLATVVKDLLIAYQFGTSDEVDAFLIAWLLPAFCLNVIADSLSAALIPTYVEAREQQGPEAARVLFCSVLGWSVLLLTLVVTALALTSEWLLPWIGGRFDSGKLALTRTLFLWLLPSLLLNGVATLLAAVLNAGERFATAAATAVAVPAFAVASLLVFGRTWGMLAVAVGTTAGYLTKVIWLGWLVRRRAGGWAPRWFQDAPQIRQVLGQYVPTVAASFLMGSTLIIDQTMAARLPAGSVAALTYGNKVVAFLIGLGALAIGTAVLPHFSAMVARQDWRALRHTVRVYSRLILAGGAVSALTLYGASELLVRLVYERGAFTQGDTRLVAGVQALAALQIPFYLMGTLLVRMAFALRRSHVLFLGTLISVPLNIVLNYVLMQRLGVAGIALSTSLVYLVATVFLGLALLPAVFRDGGDRPVAR